MSSITYKNFDAPDEFVEFDRAELRHLNVGNDTFTRGTFHPGWRWTESMGPVLGWSTCKDEHRVFVVSGRLRIEMDAGEVVELASGDAGVVGAGHDACVVGDDPVVALYFYPGPKDDEG